jgi:hypothetical protein
MTKPTIRPADLANALQDRIHPSSGRLIAAHPIRPAGGPMTKPTIQDVIGDAELVLAWADQTRFGDRGLRNEVERAAAVIRKLLEALTRDRSASALQQTEKEK